MATRTRRRRLRLPHFDYSTHGAYFVTACTHQRRCTFGTIDGDTVRLAAPGEIVAKWWNAIPSKFNDVETDSFVVMPNHVHGILWIIDRSEGGEDPASASTTLPRVMQWFKTMSTNEFIRAARRARQQAGSLWQRSYWERVIRDDRALEDIRRYIEHNPRTWADDDENPANRAGMARATRGIAVAGADALVRPYIGRRSQ